MNRSTPSIPVAGAARRYLLAERKEQRGALMLSLHLSRASADRPAQLGRLAGLIATAGAVVALPWAILPLGAGYQQEEVNVGRNTKADA